MGEQRNPFHVEMGRRIRRRRNDLQLMQYQVADQIGMNTSQYSLLEQGRRSLLDPELLAKLARALRTSADYLLQLTEYRGEIPELCSPGAGLSLDGVPPLPAMSPSLEGPSA